VVIGQEKLPQDVELLLREYRADLVKAKQGSDKILEAEGSKIAAKLIRENLADEVGIVAGQIKQKIGGGFVSEIHKDLHSLFTAYDKAVLSAQKAVRERYRGRADAMIRAYEGKDIQAVVALAEIQKEIALDATISSSANMIDSKESIVGRYVFRAAGRSFKRELKGDGTVSAEIPGRWMMKGKNLRVEYDNGAWVDFRLPSVSGKLIGKTHKNEDMEAEKVTQ
jgi:hypothetical protein